MINTDMTRRAFVGSLAAAGAAAGADGWVDLFDGKSLAGWKASENPTSWKVSDGHLFADGPRSHLFYSGPVNGADFRNFELEAEVLTKPGCNSGIFFHTRYQEKGFPQKGLEIQVNNTATGEGTYRERKKTASLYGVRNIYKQLVPDDQWFTIAASVRGRNVQIRLNGTLLVDYVQPNPPVLASGSERERIVDRGTFALQCHDPGSKARYRRIRVRPLPDSADAAVAEPVVDDTYRRILTAAGANIPVVDFHAHLKGGLTLEQLLEKGRREGVQYGIAVNCGKGFPVENDDAVRRFYDSVKGQPVFLAMQAEGREWTQMFSRAAVSLFDYVFTDSMTWTDNRGKRMRLWMPNEVGTISDEQEFMDTLVERAAGILEREPVDIYVNPTFLPESIAARYDSLWTDERIRKVVSAAVRNGVAIEINDRYKLPGKRFLAMAKEAGAKFTFGTNNGGANDLRRSEYGLQMTAELKLRWQDFFVPGAWGPKAVERKPGALRAG
jgi:hypothetical protein